MRSTIFHLGCLVALLSPEARAAQSVVALTNTKQLCDQYENYTIAGGKYSILTNQWGADGSGSQCMTVGDSASSDQSNATAFSATWAWQKSPNAVHSYPNAYLNSKLLPLRLTNLSSLEVDLQWSYDKSDTDDSAGKVASANVAVDMFFDEDPSKAVSTTEPAYEVMVWIGRFGSIHPIGYEGGVRAERKIKSGNFKLYIGSNGAGQQVYTWVGSKNRTTFKDDISPLIRRVAYHGGPDASDYLGVVQFGSEAFHTAGGANVTFNATRIDLEVRQGIAPADSQAAIIRNSKLLASLLGGICVFAILHS